MAFFYCAARRAKVINVTGVVKIPRNRYCGSRHVPSPDFLLRPGPKLRPSGPTCQSWIRVSAPQVRSPNTAGILSRPLFVYIFSFPISFNL